MRAEACHACGVAPRGSDAQQCSGRLGLLPSRLSWQCDLFLGQHHDRQRLVSYWLWLEQWLCCWERRLPRRARGGICLFAACRACSWPGRIPDATRAKAWVQLGTSTSADASEKGISRAAAAVQSTSAIPRRLAGFFGLQLGWRLAATAGLSGQPAAGFRWFHRSSTDARVRVHGPVRARTVSLSDAAAIALAVAFIGRAALGSSTEPEPMDSATHSGCFLRQAFLGNDAVSGLPLQRRWRDGHARMVEGMRQGGSVYTIYK